MAFFSVTWRIENFSMCPHKAGKTFKSPTFILPEPPELRNTKWNFWLYPRGKTVLNGNQVSFYIERKDPDPDQSSKIETFFIALSVISQNSHPGSHHRTYRQCLELACNTCTGYSQFISREALLNPDEGYLANDTLTIYLSIYPKRFEGRLGVPHPKNIFPINLSPNYTVEKGFSKDGDAEDMPLNHCSFLTRIPVERKRLNWTIKELSAKRKSKERTSVILDSEFNEGVKLLLVIYVEGFRKDDESLRIDISRKGMNLGLTFIKCEAVFLDDSNVVRGAKKFELFYDKTYQCWSFPLIDELSSTDKYLTDHDSLELLLDFTISYAPQRIDYLTGRDSSNQSELQKEIEKMLEYGETFDASFECRSGNKFPVHKFLLFAKSPVFRAMFSSDTLEKQTGVIRMRDTDTDTVQHLRDFLYYNSLPDLGTEDILKLYSVADKYQMEKLKGMCVTFLKCNMTVDNVLETLTMADMHQDAGLKDYAHDFLIAEMDFDSDLWKTFIDENLPLAAEAMRMYCVKDIRLRNMKYF